VKCKLILQCCHNFLKDYKETKMEGHFFVHEIQVDLHTPVVLKFAV
jgi:hypothetical protein